MITTILIDIDNTLLDFNACAKEAMRDGFLKVGLPFYDEMFENFVRINDQLWLDIENGTITRPILHKIRWNMIFESLGIKADGEAFEKLFLQYIFDSHVLVEGALDIVKYLSGKYKLYAASNGMHNQQINRLTRAGMIDYFDGVFASEAIGVQKPEKGFFDGVFDRLRGIKKEDVIMIGDSLSADIFGAKSYGIKTIWFNEKGVENKNGVVPDHTVLKLCEIKSIL